MDKLIKKIKMQCNNYDDYYIELTHQFNILCDQIKMMEKKNYSNYNTTEMSLLYNDLEIIENELLKFRSKCIDIF